MDLLPVFLAGPLVAAVGIVSVFFVMRRRAVDKKSMYSARRSQIERKVRAARQRTLAPTGRRSKEETAVAAAPAMEFGMEAKPPAPTATWAAPPAAAQETWASPPAAAQETWASPPAAAPAASPADNWAAPAASAPAAPAAPAPVQQPWDVGPTAPPPAPTYAAPPEPAYTPPAPEPAYSPPEPAAPVDLSSWTPAPAETIPAPMETAAPVPAGGQASWEVVGQAAPAAEPETDKKSKKDKDKEKSATGAWQLASGMAPGEEADDEIVKRPSATMAIAQYAILVVGLVMVLIGVIVMIGNSSQ